ncbi:GDP dissociation inhibitor, partial [Coemansia spiralis]
NEHFDTLIVGTGATESIIANELSAAGHKVLHIDRNSYYGGPNACFSLSGTAQETLDGLLANDRAYMVEPVPKLVLCRGNMIDLLVDQGVGDFMRFRGVDHNYLVTRQGLERVPESKEDIFASTSLTLVEKRKLMRLMTTLGANLEKPEGSFSQLLAQQFKLTGKLHDTVLYAIARQTGYELSAQEGCDRVYKYVNSIGRYGRMAYLCAQYGGGSEIAQSFCRLCAVTGGTYILDEKLECIEPNEDGFKVSLRRGTAQVSRIVMDPGYYSPNSAALDSVVSRAVCILDNPVLGT